MAYYKPQSPLIMNGNGIYPLTTYDQIILPDNTRWNGLSTEVSIEPTITSGTKLATITIDGVSKDLYYQASSVNLNGVATTTASFYAPVQSGSSGNLLVSKGPNSSPGWTNYLPTLNIGSYNSDVESWLTYGRLGSDGTSRHQVKTYINSNGTYLINISTDGTIQNKFSFSTNSFSLQTNNYPQIQLNNQDGKPRGLIYQGTGDGTPGALAFRAYSDDTNFKEMYLDPSSGILYSNGGFGGYLYGTAQDAVYGLNLKGVHEDKAITGWMSYNDSSPVFITAFDGITQWGIQRDGGNTQLHAHFYDTTNGAYLASHILLDHYNYSQYALPLTGGTLTGVVTHQNAVSVVTTNYHPTYMNSVPGIIRYEGPYSSTAEDGTITYVDRNRFVFRQYSATGEPYTARSSYYYDFRLLKTPAGLTKNKIFYLVPSTAEGVKATTSKRYVMGISGENGSIGYNASVYTSGSVLYGACWNDYAEYRNQIEEIKPGYITYSEDDGKLRLTTERLQAFEGIVSDTFGYAIGETEENKTPLAVSGRALVYCNPDDDFHSGDCVCAGPGGLAYRMTREEIVTFPDRIVGIVSEIPAYETWGTGNVNVNGRIWVKVR